MKKAELVIIMILYLIATVREVYNGNLPMAFVWFCYASSLVGFIAMP